MTHEPFPLIQQHGNPLKHVSRVPSTVGEIYLRWRKLPPHTSLTRRLRNERRWLARHLEFAANRGEITHDHSPDGRHYFFVAAVDPHAAKDDKPGGTERVSEVGHADARGVVE